MSVSPDILTVGQDVIVLRIHNQSGRELEADTHYVLEQWTGRRWKDTHRLRPRPRTPEHPAWVRIQDIDPDAPQTLEGGPPVADDEILELTFDLPPLKPGTYRISGVMQPIGVHSRSSFTVKQDH